MTDNNIKIFNKKEILLFNKLLKSNFNDDKIHNLMTNKDLDEIGKKTGFYKKSAVLCLLEPDRTKNTYNIILTERSKKLKDHAGQISFPGGKLEFIDNASYKNCAYREAAEEIGFEKDKINYLGKLNKYLTGTGYLIQPIVVIGISNQKLKHSANEVSRILHLPVNHLLFNKNIDKIFYNSDNKYYYSITWNKFEIWGATAKILIDLFRILKNLW